MAVITLTTDFGTKDPYLAVLKGNFHTSLPSCVLVDISHEITKFDILEASFILGGSWKSFPPGTIHLVSVNAVMPPPVRFIAIKAAGHFFLGADNGLFSLFLNENEIEEMAELEQSGPDSFPASNVLRPAAVKLANGEAVTSLGNKITTFNQKRMLDAFSDSNSLTGRVAYIDSYENAITNITRSEMEKVAAGRNFSISLRPKRTSFEFGPTETNIRKISESYSSVPEGEITAFFNQSGLLEIAINQGNAGGLLGLRPGDLIRIIFE